eukprot:8078659-Pyramimonas_sp.AAC.1
MCIRDRKNSELPLGHKDRKYKGRVVFDGSSVRDHNKDVALFKNFPAALLQCRPAKQLTFTDCLKAIVLNKRMPAKLILGQSWAAPLHGYFYPAMNGLKNGRICVIQYCIISVIVWTPRFGRIPGATLRWRSCYFHKKLKLFLISYVGDFKLAGPADKLAGEWKLLQAPPLTTVLEV